MLPLIPMSSPGGGFGTVSRRNAIKPTTTKRPPTQQSRYHPDFVVFGVDLEELIQRPDHQNQLIPLIVRQCLRFLSAPEFLNREGLFRTPGRESDINDLRNRFDNGAHIRFPSTISPDTVASLLKLYLGCLPDPPFERRLTPDLLILMKNSGSAPSLQDIQKLVSSLSPEHKQLLTDIFAFTWEFVQHTASNRMNSTSCGIVLGPVVFRALPEWEDNIGMMEQIKLLNKATTLLIDKYTEIFDPQAVSYTRESASLEEQASEQLISPDFDVRLQAAFVVRVEKLELQGQALKQKLKDDDLLKLAPLSFLREIDLSSNLIQDLPDNFPPNIERLNLSKNNMKNAPRNLELLHSLKFLSLRLNEIKTWPKGVNALEHLEELDVAFNAITSIQYSVTLMGIFNTNSNAVPPMATSLTSLDVSFNTLTEFPRKLLDFRKLRHLNLSSNNILDVPDEIEVLQECLNTLRIARCGFSRFPQSVHKMCELRVLDISGNAIRVLPVEITYLPQLRELYLSETEIGSLYPLYFLQRLEVLDVSRNNIDTIPDEFQYLRNLRELNISKNRIGAIPSCMSSLQKLEVLDASKNSIKTVDPCVGLLSNLHTLRLDNNSISQLPPLIKMQQLRVLTLGVNEISELPDVFDALSDCLEELDLESNHIGSIPPSVYNLTSLQRLRLQHNAISQIDPAIGHLISLDSLNLDNNLLDGIPSEIMQTPLKSLSFNNNGEIQLSEEMSAWRDANGVAISAKFETADKVLPGLYIGSQSAAVSRNALQKLGITHVLTLAKNIPPPHPNHFTYFIVEENDVPTTNLRQHFEACNKFIDEGRAAGGTLVHCQAGVSRSATIVTAYVMYHKRVPLKKAFAHLRKVRPQVFPITAFRRQLQAYNDELFGVPPQKASPDLPSPLKDQPTPFDQVDTKL